MKSFAIKLALISFVGLIALPGTVLADLSPTKTVEAIVESIKASGNASGVVEYVNWKKAYEQLPEIQRKQLGIDSSDKMKGFFTEMLASPSAALKKQMEARIQTVPADKQEQAKQSLVQFEKMMQAKEAEMKERISGTVYKVSDEKVAGNVATVKLTQTFKGETKTEEVKLEKEGDKWLLPTLNSMGGDTPPPGAGGAAAPAAKAPAAAAPAPAAKAPVQKK